MAQLDVYIGQINLFAFDRVPSGWIPCDGRQVPLVSYQALYALLGTKFGGDGKTYFKVPDFRGFFPTMPIAGQGIGAKGGTAGSSQIQITTDNLPAHTHPATFTGSPASATASVGIQAKLAQGGGIPADGGFLGEGGAGQGAASIYVAPGSTAAGVNLSGGQATVSVTAAGTVAVGPAGGAKPLSVPIPFQCVMFYINYDGLYPDFN